MLPSFYSLTWLGQYFQPSYIFYTQLKLIDIVQQKANKDKGSASSFAFYQIRLQLVFLPYLLL